MMDWLLSRNGSKSAMVRSLYANKTMLSMNDSSTPVMKRIVRRIHGNASSTTVTYPFRE